MTKERILLVFKDINQMYNNARMYDGLSRMLDELVEDCKCADENVPKFTWTPVSEGLPEPWASVLVTFSGKYGNLTADHAVGIGSWDGSNGWYFEEIEGYTDRLTVEAWMNLPESYKGE